MYDFIDFLTGDFFYQGISGGTNLFKEFNIILRDFFLNSADDGFLPFTLFISLLMLGFGIYLFRRIIYG